MPNQPKVSIVIISWNNQHNIGRCIDFIKKQSYPKAEIEIINVDGGSTDDTTKIVNTFNNTFASVKIIRTKIKDQEPKRAIGIIKASGKYVCSIDPDVYITDKNWLRSMITPLERNPELTGSQTLYYQHSFKESVINRYFALFGVNDPLALYLGKADRIPHYQTKWTNGSAVKDMESYFEVQFKENIPTMGANGVVYRRDAYMKTKFTQESFFHIDVIVDMVRMGNNRFAIVKNSVLHSTGSTFWGSIKKRIIYMRTHYLKRQQERRYLLYNPRDMHDNFNLGKFIFFTVTLVQPAYLSFRGFLIKRDLAWFIHLPMCWGFLFAYSIAVLQHLQNRLLLKAEKHVS